MREEEEEVPNLGDVSRIKWAARGVEVGESIKPRSSTIPGKEGGRGRDNNFLSSEGGSETGYALARCGVGLHSSSGGNRKEMGSSGTKLPNSLLLLLPSSSPPHGAIA